MLNELKDTTWIRRKDEAEFKIYFRMSKHTNDNKNEANTWIWVKVYKSSLCLVLQDGTWDQPHAISVHLC